MSLITTDSVLLRFGIATWMAFVLMNLSFAAMGIELRRRGVPIEWLSYSLNLRVRFAKVAEVTQAYRQFKQQRNEFPWSACAMITSAAGVFVIPLVALLYRLLAVG